MKKKSLRFWILVPGSVITLSVLGWILFTQFGQKSESDSQESAGVVEEDSVSREVATNSFGVSSGLSELIYTVVSGDNVSTILNKNGVSHSIIQSVLDAAQPFDLTRIGVGKSFYFYYESGSKSPAYIVYVPNSMEFLRIAMTPRVEAKLEKKSVEMQQASMGGIIHSSLYQSIDNQGKDVALAYGIADVFKWSIDFFALQKGDKYKVVYTEKVVDGESKGTEDVLAAYFYHGGKEYWAIRFDQGDKIGYYDLEGQSMKSRFLQAPLEFTRISSGYSKSRYHPILKRSTPHLGIDYAAPTGTPIVSVADGIILEAQYKGGNGNYVKVKHDDTYSTQYLHMSKFGEGIKKGVRVIQGQIIGYVGSTGLSTGPHLCFRFWKNGQQVDPTQETPQVTEPLQDAYKEAFFKYRDEILPRLQQTGYYDNARKNAIESLGGLLDI